MHLATSSCNPACQERRSITAFLHTEPCQGVLSQPGSNLHTPNRPTFPQCWHWNFGLTNPVLLRPRFWWFLCEIDLSLRSRAHFADLIFQSAPDASFFKGFFCEIELSPVLCTFLRQLSQIEARNPGNSDPTSATRKNPGFRARECFHPWTHKLPNCHSSQ